MKIIYIIQLQTKTETDTYLEENGNYLEKARRIFNKMGGPSKIIFTYVLQ